MAKPPIEIKAQVLSQAYPIRFGSGYVVQMLLAQRLGLPILVEWMVGEGAAASIAAHSAAAQLRRGTPVTVAGNHLEVARHLGTPCLRLCGEITVDRPIHAPHTETAADAA